MKKLLIGLLLGALLLVGVSKSDAVIKIVGGQAACDTAFAGCFHIPSTFGVLCNQFVVNVACPKQFHPSWVDGNRFWGSNAVEFCVTSVNRGVNWAECTTQPFAGAAVMVAGTTNGNVVAMSTVAGACVFKLSVNNGTSWTTQLTDTGIPCQIVPSGAQTVRCQPASGRCDYVSADGINFRAYQSNDNGVSWSKTTILSGSTQNGSSMVFDGSKGITGGSISIGTREGQALAGVWNISSVWTGSNNYGTSSAANWDSLGASVLFAFEGVIFTYRQLDPIGTVLKSFIPTGAKITGFPTLDCFQYNSSVDYCVGFEPAGGQAFWMSIDDLASTILLGSNAAVAGRGTIYALGGSIYIAVAGTTGAFYKIS